MINLRVVPNVGISGQNLEGRMQGVSGVFLNVPYNWTLHRPQLIPYIFLSVHLYSHVCFRFHITYAF